jgi:hypothetical protein
METNYSFKLISIETLDPQFIRHNDPFIGGVRGIVWLGVGWLGLFWYECVRPFEGVGVFLGRATPCLAKQCQAHPLEMNHDVQ